MQIVFEGHECIILTRDLLLSCLKGNSSDKKLGETITFFEGGGGRKLLVFWLGVMNIGGIV